MHSHSATTVHSVEKLVTEVTLDMQFFWVSLKFQEFVLICSDLQFGKDFLFGLFQCSIFREKCDFLGTISPKTSTLIENSKNV